MKEEQTTHTTQAVLRTLAKRMAKSCPRRKYWLIFLLHEIKGPHSENPEDQGLGLGNQ